MTSKKIKTRSRSQQSIQLNLQDWRRSSAYSQLERLVTPKVKKEAFDAFGFGTEIASRKHRESTSTVDLNSVEALRLAYNNAREREGKLKYALSQTQMECNENKSLFRETLDLAETLNKENRGLKENLRNESNSVYHLRQKLKLIKRNREVLAEEIEDFRTEMDKTARKRAEVVELNALAKAKSTEQEKLQSSIKDQHTSEKYMWDLNTREAINKQTSNLEQERAYCKKIECRLWETETRLEVAENLIDKLLKENEELKGKFEVSSTSNSSSQEVVGTRNEKTSESGSQVLNTWEVGSHGAHEKIPIIYDDDALESMSAAYLLHKNSDRKSLSLSELSVLESGVYSDSENVIKDQMVPASVDALQKYLYITATAVKLHLPDLKFVEVNSLMQHVNEAPFYLWYDLMMAFMQELKWEEAIKELYNGDSVPQSYDEQLSLLDRFRKLMQGGRRSSNYKSKTLEADDQYTWSKYPALLRGRPTSVFV